MAHTSEQRDHLKTPLCGAMRKNGKPCRLFAGSGTDHKGIGRCRRHGGNTPTHKQNAVTVEAKRKMVKLGEPIAISPHEALLWQLRTSAGHVAWLQGSMTGDDLTETEARAVARMYDDERDRLTRIAKTCSDVGVEEKRIRIEMQNAALFATAVEAALVQFGLESDQRREVHMLTAQKLDAIEGTGTELVRAPARKGR